MAAPTARFSKHPTLAMRIFILVGLTSVTLCDAALASETEDAIKLYESGKFRESREKFEEVLNETLRDSRCAYYYALSLNSSGHTPEAIVVCRQIMGKFPNSEGARASKAAIEKWAQFNAVANASAAARKLASRPIPPVDPTIGILGLKFEMVAGSLPKIMMVFPDTPASQFLKRNDVITAVNGTPTINLSKEEIYDLIVGVPGTAVSITIRRNDELITHSFVRLSAVKFSKQHPEIWQVYQRSM